MTKSHPLLRCLALYRFMPYQFSVTALLFILVNIGVAWQLWLVGKIIDDIRQDRAISKLSDGTIDLSQIKYWLILLVIVASIRGVLQYIGGIMSLSIGQKLLTILRDRILTQVQRLDLAYHWQHGMGEIITRTTRDADKVRDALINFWRQVFEASLWVIISVALLSWYNPWLGIGTLLFTLLGVSIFVAQTDRLVQLDRAVGDAYDKVNQELSEGVNGVRVIKSFGLEQQRIIVFTDLVTVFVNNAKAALAYASSRIPVPQIVIAFSYVWILAFGAYLIQQGKLNVGELVAALLVANTLVFRIEGIGRVIQVFADARSSAARIWDLLDEKPGIISGKQSISDGALGLRLNNVSVTTPNKGNTILQHLDFEVSPGEIVAIVGVTGSGKSTLAGLIPRLLEVNYGEVLIGSAWAGWKNVKHLELDALRKKVHVVPQESFLFSDTLEANLRLAKPNATEAELKRAIALASATEVLDNLAHGLQTKIGDRGITLSGGQRQRISLARAFLAEPEILILDDSTSALDAITESRVLENIRTLRNGSGQGITVILIASKLSTILLADRVAMLHNGKIHAQGTHENLVSNNAEYRDLVGVEHGK
ncbi:ABC transporter ATP-binding protein [Methylovorus sp. MM2]|uniref:ABC transporter ATP-binding protein n=1 Tax=Methylovorus sp. MM2 TaxID=1848038 RepID=UPI0007E19BE4|nr:ABC transporter ATP-binding protein [Methylovorus sp. MM2]OAM51876.1 ABC transporter ATP-binding protein [Methylovorus sp. MM2]